MATAKELIDRWIAAVNARQFDSLLDLFGRDYVFVDKRQIGWEEAAGPKETAAIAQSFELVSEDFAASYEWIGGDERSLAIKLHVEGTSREGGGPFSMTLGHVAVVKDGLFARTEQLDPEDEEAMLKRLAELRQEL